MSETRKELFDHLARQGEEITLLREQLAAATRVVDAAKAWVVACETDEAITAASAWDNLTAPEYLAACDALIDTVTALKLKSNFFCK